MAARRRLAILAAAPLLAASGCSTERAHGAAIARVAGPPVADRVAWVEPAPPSVLDVPPAEMREAVRASYRLRPDRRMVLAVAEVHHLLTGRPLAPVRVTRDGDRWAIAYDGLAVGWLSDAPTWEEARALLEGWGARVAGDSVAGAVRAVRDSAPAIARRLDRFTGADVIHALGDIDAAWKTAAPHDRSLVGPAAQGLVSLLLLARDRAAATDALQARALAAVALARAHAPGTSQVRFEALLAARMGYRPAALRIVEALPPSDVTRRFVRGDLGALAAAALVADAPPLNRHLYLVALAESEEEDAWREVVRRHDLDLVTDPATAGTGLGIGSADLDGALPAMLQEAVVAELTAQGGKRTIGDRVRATLLRSYGALGVTLAQIGGGLHPARALHRLDREVARVTRHHQGPFLDGALIADHYRAQLYSAYLGAADHALDLPSAASDAMRLVRRFDGVRRDSPDGELGEWLAHYLKADAGTMPADSLLEDLSRFPSISGELMDDLYRAIPDSQASSDASSEKSVRAVFDRYDSRPSLRRHFIRTARHTLHDPVLAARYAGSTDDALRSDPELAAWLATVARDTVGLLAVVRDTAADVKTRARALERVAGMTSWADSITDGEYQALVASARDSWAAREKYIAYLRRLDAHDAAERVARDFLARGQPTPHERLLALASIARTLQAQEQFDTAWREIEPLIGTAHPEVLALATELLARRGQLAAADSVGARAAGRYPRLPHVLAARLEVWWRQERHDLVATALRAHHDLAGDEHVTRNFAAVFGDSVPRAMAAVDSLIANGATPGHLQSLALGLARHGRPDLAFVVEASVRPTRPEDAVRAAVRAYGYLRAADGDDVALDWLRKRTGRDLDDAIAVLLYSDGQDDLLWIWDAVAPRAYPEYVWFLRAAGLVRADTTSPHRAELEAYYREPRADPYHTMGRYLMGFEHEATVLTYASSAERRCEVAYVLGLKAEAEGRWRDAVEWYRVAVETRSVGDGEYQWARQALVRLSEGEKPTP